MEGHDVTEEDVACLFDINSTFSVEVFDRVARETLDPNTTIAKREFNFKLMLTISDAMDPTELSKRMCLVLNSEQASSVGASIAANMLRNVVARRFRSFATEQQTAIRKCALQYLLRLNSQAEVIYDALSFAITLLVEVFKRSPSLETAFVDELINSARGTESEQQRSNVLITLFRALKVFVEDATSLNSTTKMQRDDLSRILSADQRRILSIVIEALGGRLVSPSNSVVSGSIPVNVNDEFVVRSLDLLASLIPVLDLDRVLEPHLLDTIFTFLAKRNYKVEALRCLVEVVSLDFNVTDPTCNLNSHDVGTGTGEGLSFATPLANLFKRTMACARTHIDDDLDLTVLVNRAADLQHADTAKFLHLLAVFLSTFLTKYARVVEHPRYAAHSHLGAALKLLVRVTRSSGFSETFKVCVDYWCTLTAELVAERDVARPEVVNVDLRASDVNEKVQCWIQGSDPRARGSVGAFPESRSMVMRLNIYRSQLRDVCSIYLECMPSPVVYREVNDEFGEKRLEVATYGDEPTLYEPMRDTMCALAQLDYPLVRQLIIGRTDLVREHARLRETRDPVLINEFKRLCFAVGSLASAIGTMEDDLVSSIAPELAGAVRLRNDRGLPRETVAEMFIALAHFYMQFQRYFYNESNSAAFELIYSKLLDIMHRNWEERYVATELFCRMASDFSECFVRGHSSGTCRVARLLDDVERELMECADEEWPCNIVTFHKAIGFMIAALNAASDGHAPSIILRKQVEWIDLLMAPTNREFSQRINSLSNGRRAELHSLRQLSIILQINVRVLDVVRKPFRRQLDRIVADCVPLFRILSTAINNQLGTCDGDSGTEEQVMQSPLTLAMRAVRSDILKLLQCRVARFTDEAVLRETVDQLDLIADSYLNSHPLAREAGLLRTMKAIACARSLAHSAELQSRYLSIALDKLYKPTLEMLGDENDVQYPEHEDALYGMLGSLILNTFQPLSRLFGEVKFEELIETLLRGLRSMRPEVNELSLIGIHDLLERFGSRESTSQRFFLSHYGVFLLYSLYMLLLNSRPTLLLAQTELLRKLIRCVTANIIIFNVESCFDCELEELKEPEVRLLRSSRELPRLQAFNIRASNGNILKREIIKISKSVLQPDDVQSYVLDEQIELFAEGLFAFEDNAQLRDFISEFLIEIREAPSADGRELHLEDRRRVLAEIAYRRTRDVSSTGSAPAVGTPQPCYEDVLANLAADNLDFQPPNAHVPASAHRSSNLSSPYFHRGIDGVNVNRHEGQTFVATASGVGRSPVKRSAALESGCSPSTSRSRSPIQHPKRISLPNTGAQHPNTSHFPIARVDAARCPVTSSSSSSNDSTLPKTFRANHSNLLKK